MTGRPRDDGEREATVTDVHRRFADYINRVACQGESFVLLRGGKPVAELSPVPSGTRLGELTGILASLPRPDESDAAAFGDDVARAREALGTMTHRDPWAS